MSKRVLAAIVLLLFIAAAGCARPVSAPQPPGGGGQGPRLVRVVAKDRWILGCHLVVTPNRVNARRGETVRWELMVEDAKCGSQTATVKIVMKWEDCRGRANSEEPLDLSPPAAGSHEGTVRANATIGQCLQYGVFAGELFKDPELIIDG